MRAGKGRDVKPPGWRPKQRRGVQGLPKFEHRVGCLASQFVTRDAVIFFLCLCRDVAPLSRPWARRPKIRALHLQCRAFGRAHDVNSGRVQVQVLGVPGIAHRPWNQDVVPLQLDFARPRHEEVRIWVGHLAGQRAGLSAHRVKAGGLGLKVACRRNSIEAACVGCAWPTCETRRELPLPARPVVPCREWKAGCDPLILTLISTTLPHNTQVCLERFVQSPLMPRRYWHSPMSFLAVHKH